MDFFDIPASADSVIVLAHGAGAPADSEFMAKLTLALNKQNIGVIRFEFAYMDRRRLDGKKSPPGRIPGLVDEFQQNLHRLTVDITLPVFIAGKSMGGRIASMLLAQENAVQAKNNGLRGVLCFGYPFHPPSKPHSLRTKHLHGIDLPIVIVQGTRDPFGKLSEISSFGVPKHVLLRWLDHCDHDFVPTKRSGFNPTEQIDEAALYAREFIDSIL